MRLIHCAIIGVLALPFISLEAHYGRSQKNAYLKQNPYQEEYQNQPEEVAEENRFENTLYDRQQNQRDQAERNLQQQYYYQQPAGNNNGTQYNRTKTPRNQYFNPLDD